MKDRINIFYEENFDDHSRTLINKMQGKIESENANYLLNVNEAEYLDYLINEFKVVGLTLDFDTVSIEPKEIKVRGDQFPGGGFLYSVDQSKSYPKQAITYHLPFSGNANLLQYTPNPYVADTVQIYIGDASISFDVVNFENDASQIKSNADRSLQLIRRQYESLLVNLQTHNASISQQAKTFLDARRKILMERNSLVASLGVPVRKSDNLPHTFAVPTVQKKITVSKPAASTVPYAPEPAVDQSIYQDIIRVIQDAGRNFERLPSVYAKKGEEDLRDHLIFVLEPHFASASTTGETFNKEGKTDILVRYDKKNVFVGECKFWNGDKVHTQTINQILSYLTFRDSKAAIIYFVRQMGMSPVLTTIETNTPSHPCFVSFNGKVEDTWFSYKFHLPGDTGRSVQLAIMCFHIPT